MSTVTIREPEFTPTERAALLAYVAHRNNIGQYGENLDEAMSPDADLNNRDAKFHYVATSARNHAAAAVDRTRAEFEKKYPDDPMYGFRWSVARVENPTALPQR